jgi:hypothetical protein
MGAFIQPALEVLECSLCELLTGGDNPVLSRLAAVCPRLRQLCLLPSECADGFTNDEANDHAAAVCAVLDALPAVDSLHLPRACLDGVSAALYACLAGREALTSLRVERLTLQPSPPPFRALQELEAEFDIDSLAHLADAVPSVERLTLDVWEWDGGRRPGELLGPLAALQHLRALDFRCEFVPARLAGAELAASIGALSPQLRVLRLHLVRHELPIVDFSDATLAQVLARLPCLVELVLLVNSAKTTSRAFRVAGEYCQLLQLLALSERCSLWALEDAEKTPLFPRLRLLLTSCCLSYPFWSPPLWE